MIVHLNFIGITLVLLALMHVGFPSRFEWKRELASLSLMNRQMMYVHTFFIALVLFLIGLLCLTSSSELLETALGKKICLGLGVFWFVRLYCQFFVYSSELWRGKKFETAAHILFSIYWVYLSIIFFRISFM